MSHKPEDILKNLKQGNYSPIYFLHGDESYYIDAISDFIEENALPEQEKGFNQVIMYGKDVTMGQIVNNARKFPMMAARQVVIVKEFQEVSDLKQDAAQSLLQKYVEQPLASTILVLNHKHKSFDKRKALYKVLDKSAIVIESKKLYDNQVPDWINRLVKEKGYNINPQATALLQESIGNELTRLQKEIDKIAINLKDQKDITTDIIQEYVGISKEYNVFELQKALITKDIMKANKIIHFFALNPKDHPIIPIIAILYQFFSKLLMAHHSTNKSDQHLAKLLGVNPYFVKDYTASLRQYSLAKVIRIIDYLRTADLQSKGVESGSMTEGAILKELVYKILH